MKRYKIRLDTMSDIHMFCEAVRKITPVENRLELKGDDSFSVSPYSLLGLMYASSEFKNCYLYSEREIYDAIKDFVIE